MDRQQRRLLERKQARSPQRAISLGRAASKPAAPSPAALGAIIQEALGLAQQRLGDGQLDEARQLYEGVLEIKPNQPDALLGLAGIAVRIGQPEAARTILTRGIAAHPQLGRLHSEHATVLRQLNRLDEAIAGYRRVAALMRQGPTAWNNLGTVLYENLQFEESRQGTGAPSCSHRSTHAVTTDSDSSR
jgi:Tfp pilus assembly protein PilF